VIVTMHVATGAAGGALAGSRWRAVPLGLLLHFLGDVLPHEDLDSRRFELASGVSALVALALRRGVLDPATLGAVACAAPDVEHVLPLPGQGDRGLFPSHRWKRFHRSGGVPVAVQLLAAGLLLVVVLAVPNRDEIDRAS